MAHAMVVAEHGLKKFEPLLPDVILRGKDCAYLVGCATNRIEPPVPMKNWARSEIRQIGADRFIVIFLRLFAYIGPPDKGTPTYSIIVGKFIPWWARLARWSKALPRRIEKKFRPSR